MSDRRSMLHMQLSVAAMAIPLLILAIFVRALSSWYIPQHYQDIRWIITDTLRRGYLDVATVFGATLLTILALQLMRRRPRVQCRIIKSYYLFAAVMAVLFCVNSRALEIIGGPLTYQWLYYGDFLRSFTSRSAIASAVDASLLFLFAISFFALIVGQRGLSALFRAVSAGSSVFIVGLCTFFVIAFLVYGHRWLKAEDENYREIANPMIELITTAFARDASSLSSLPTTSNIDPPVDGAASVFQSHYNTDRLIKNVILIVMESVGAKYVIGSKARQSIEVTPQLAKLHDKSLTFNNFYAHTPMSTRSLFSILASRYPLFSYRTEISRVGDSPVATLGGRLKDEGYRTAFFMSGDFKFQKVDQFLRGRGFDVLSDMNTIRCDTPKFVGSTTAWPNLDSVDDECTAAELSKWIGDGSGAPFFGMFWTGNTHWPYFTKDEQIHISDEKPHLNRYLNALRSTDAAIGKVFEHLEVNGLWNTTLVVVIGDHGEAFGEHGSKVHGNSIYEEEVHIPFLLFNPVLFHGNQIKSAGGLVDLAPTILDLLKIEPPFAWQGRSMFARERPSCVYLMVPNSEMVAGYKKGDFKFIFNSARNKISVFDLQNDPGEARNLLQELPGVEKEIQNRLAAWVQSQAKLLSGAGAAQESATEMRN